MNKVTKRILLAFLLTPIVIVVTACIEEALIMKENDRRAVYAEENTFNRDLFQRKWDFDFSEGNYYIISFEVYHDRPQEVSYDIRSLD